MNLLFGLPRFPFPGSFNATIPCPTYVSFLLLTCPYQRKIHSRPFSPYLAVPRIYLTFSFLTVFLRIISTEKMKHLHFHNFYLPFGFLLLVQFLFHTSCGLTHVMYTFPLDFSDMFLLHSYLSCQWRAERLSSRGEHFHD